MQSFATAGIDLEWGGRGDAEIGRCAASGRTIISIDPQFYRPAEVDSLIGDADKAERVLGWKATMSVAELARIMVTADLAREHGGPVSVHMHPSETARSGAMKGVIINRPGAPTPIGAATR